MNITPITAVEFPLSRHRLSPIAKAVHSLKEIGDGFSTPCIWEHRYKSKNCGGYHLAYYAAKRAKIRVRITCQDGTYYVLRIEPD
jgi:hypothetical protein